MCFVSRINNYLSIGAGALASAGTLIGANLCSNSALATIKAFGERCPNDTPFYSERCADLDRKFLLMFLGEFSLYPTAAIVSACVVTGIWETRPMQPMNEGEEISLNSSQEPKPVKKSKSNSCNASTLTTFFIGMTGYVIQMFATMFGKTPSLDAGRCIAQYNATYIKCQALEATRQTYISANIATGTLVGVNWLAIGTWAMLKSRDILPKKCPSW